MTQATQQLRIDAKGRLTVPAEVLTTRGLGPGDVVLVTRDAGGLRLLALSEAVRRAQATVRHYVPEGRSLSDGLIADRRAEAERE